MEVDCEAPPRLSFLAPGQTLPLVVEPPRPDVDLAAWGEAHRDYVEERLAAHGALLFRGFLVPTVARFEQFAAALCDQLFGDYGDLPREAEADRIYHSTPFPHEKTILFHNESSHQHTWPSKQFFHCVTAAESGGETPIVDCRVMYASLPADLLERLERKGVLYVRNFTDGLDVSWQDFFRTTDRSAVEAYCRRAGMELEWKGDGLRTRQPAVAVTRHPRSGEKIFFNQLQLHHVACLDAEVREALTEMFEPDDLPRYVCYGDGEPIEDAAMDLIGETYWQRAVAFPWRDGDVLMLDNMLVAHARKPFRGARKIVVAMGDMVTADRR